ncbi:cell division protein FtsQ/DivIB [Auraticoccus monumenti]|uniref:Cell division protein FtsQ n=1 Tax=Auraticoccus monumenti TaxID=675864 RepID=A0A1G7DM03_9ACTN|nr:FtsQ-type POTRA domain-containing protein [Auraticoccus monumenti]SDE52532.1 cell division protein FtsQ [Auraticoccus monumenti]
MPSRSSLADARPALALRTRRRRRRRLRAGVVLVLLLAVAGGLTWLVGWSSVLAATSVEVEGASVLDADEVTAAAAVPLGRPLARVDTGAVESRVAALLPVREVTVTRSWPSTVRIEVGERTPVLATGTAGGYALVDAAGVAYTTVDDVPDGVVRAELRGSGGMPADERTELMVDLATVATALSPGLREQVESVSTDSADTIELALTGDRVLEWGSAEDSDLKAEVALVLLEQEATTYDVSVPSHPTIR